MESLPPRPKGRDGQKSYILANIVNRVTVSNAESHLPPSNQKLLLYSRIYCEPDSGIQLAGKHLLRRTRSKTGLTNEFVVEKVGEHEGVEVAQLLWDGACA